MQIQKLFQAPLTETPTVMIDTIAEVGALTTDTALKMDDIKKAPCGQVPLCSSESIMSNHVRTSFVLIITVAHQKI